MKLSDLRLFGDRCIVRFTYDGLDYRTGIVVAHGPDSPLEIGDEVLFVAYMSELRLEDDGILEQAKYGIADQVHVIATVGGKPAVDLPELEPLPPPTDAEQEMFQGAADRAMAEQREKLGLPEEKCNQGVPGCSGDGSHSKPHSGAHHLALNAATINPALRDIHSPKALNQVRMTDLFSIERSDRRFEDRRACSEFVKDTRPYFEACVRCGKLEKAHRSGN